MDLILPLSFWLLMKQLALGSNSEQEYCLSMENVMN